MIYRRHPVRPCVHQFIIYTPPQPPCALVNTRVVFDKKQFYTRFYFVASADDRIYFERTGPYSTPIPRIRRRGKLSHRMLSVPNRITLGNTKSPVVKTVFLGRGQCEISAKLTDRSDCKIFFSRPFETRTPNTRTRTEMHWCITLVAKNYARNWKRKIENISLTSRAVGSTTDWVQT